MDIAREFGADVLVRGAGKERLDEKGMACLNGLGGLRTALIPFEPPTAFISCDLWARSPARWREP